MRFITNEHREKYLCLFEEYVDIYGKFYPKEALEYIKRHFLKTDFQYGFDVDIVAQVYQYLGIYNKFQDNKYKNFYDFLSSNYNLNQHLLEVASGMFPSFAQMVASKQCIGTVTAIDPDSIIDTLDGIKIIKEPLSPETDISKFDLLYAISPCEALKEIITSANKYEKEFCVLSCSCTHLPKELITYRREVFYGEYINYIESIIKETIPHNIEYKIEYTSKFNTPIISTKKRN